jgi:hypothetical protein
MAITPLTAPTAPAAPLAVAMQVLRVPRRRDAPLALVRPLAPAVPAQLGQVLVVPQAAHPPAAAVVPTAGVAVVGTAHPAVPLGALQ